MAKQDPALGTSGHQVFMSLHQARHSALVWFRADLLSRRKGELYTCLASLFGPCEKVWTLYSFVVGEQSLAKVCCVL